MNFISNEHRVRCSSARKSWVKRLSREIVEELLKRGIMLSPEEVRSLGAWPAEYKVADFVRYYSLKYGDARKRLEPFMQHAISLNKAIAGREGEFIVLVRDICSNVATVCDPTGDARVILPHGTDVAIGDIIGIAGNVGNDTIFATNVAFPELPLKMDVKSGKNDADILFVSDIHYGSASFVEKSFQNLFKFVAENKIYGIIISGDVSANGEYGFLDEMRKHAPVFVCPGPIDRNIQTPHRHATQPMLQNPSTVEIDGISICIHHKGDSSAQTPREWLTGVLKRGHLSSGRFLPAMPDGRDPFALGSDVDIIAVGGFHLQSVTNYRGFTCITSGSFIDNPTFTAMNLKTRETRAVVF